MICVTQEKSLTPYASREDPEQSAYSSSLIKLFFLHQYILYLVILQETSNVRLRECAGSPSHFLPSYAIRGFFVHCASYGNRYTFKDGNSDNMLTYLLKRTYSKRKEAPIREQILSFQRRPIFRRGLVCGKGNTASQKLPPL